MNEDDKEAKSEVIDFFLFFLVNFSGWIVHEILIMDEYSCEFQLQLATMQAEMARMSEENQRLRGVLSQMTNNYNALQMHLITLMQQRSNSGPNEVC